MYIVQDYTFAPGAPGAGTITIPATLKLEDFGVITNVSLNSVIYDPAGSNCGAILSYDGGDTILTLEQSTSYCDASDKLQIITLGETGGTSGGATEATLLEVDAKLPDLVDGQIPVLSNTESRVPTTTRVVSSASSVLILAANASRKGFSLSNISTSNLYLSFTNPATIANCFIEIPGSAFILLDQQLIVPNAIYGLWDSANGAAQVTEFV